MAWRPYKNVVEGVLDNTVLGKVTGYIKFIEKTVTFDLNGDFHRDIRGAKIKIIGDGQSHPSENYMDGFSKKQTGNVGDITAGIPVGKNEDGELLYDYSDYPYIEWYGDDNGRVVLELEPGQIEIIGSPIPIIESDPIDRNKQHENMNNFMGSMMDSITKIKHNS